MKALPCANPNCKGSSKRGARALLGFNALAMPKGEPYIIGNPSRFPFSVKCGKCKRSTSFSAVEFRKLPELSVAQLAGIGALEEASKDWTASGLRAEHAADMIAAGLAGPGAVEHRPE